MNHFKRNTPPEVIENYIKKCSPPIYKLLNSPSISRNKKPNLEKWLSKEEDAIADFLGVVRTNRTRRDKARKASPAGLY
jgi:hypothetical protein